MLTPQSFKIQNSSLAKLGKRDFTKMVHLVKNETVAKNHFRVVKIDFKVWNVNFGGISQLKSDFRLLFQAMKTQFLAPHKKKQPEQMMYQKQIYVKIWQIYFFQHHLATFTFMQLWH